VGDTGVDAAWVVGTVGHVTIVGGIEGAAGDGTCCCEGWWLM